MGMGMGQSQMIKRTFNKQDQVEVHIIITPQGATKKVVVSASSQLIMTTIGELHSAIQELLKVVDPHDEITSDHNHGKKFVKES